VANGNDQWGDHQNGRLRFSDHGAGGAAQMLVELDQVGGGICVLSIEGELDLYTEPVLRRALEAAFKHRPTSVVVDLTKCSLIDSTGLGILVRANKRLNRAGKARISVACPDRNIRRVFEITTLDSVFAVHPTRSAALNDARR
jgi:anti-sigma B factor antagonist